MQPEPVQKEILYSYSIILRGKLRNFRKKSLLKYALASLIFSAGLALVRGQAIFASERGLVFLNFFLIFLCLSFILVVISSGILARKLRGRKMLYTFSFQGIHVLNKINGQEESHGWEWISSFELTNRSLFLKIRSRTPLVIILDRDKLALEELESLLVWLRGNASS